MAPACGTSAAWRRSAGSVAASARSSSARAGSLKSLVSWICAVTVAPARLEQRQHGVPVGRVGGRPW